LTSALVSAASRGFRLPAETGTFDSDTNAREPLRVFTVDLPVSVSSLTISPEFLQSRTGYALEVLAIEASGNQTLTEIAFTVR
jgi:hypothetical protein